MHSPGQDQAAKPDNPPSSVDEAGVEVLKDKFKLDERAAYKLSEVSWWGSAWLTGGFLAHMTL